MRELQRDRRCGGQQDVPPGVSQAVRRARQGIGNHAFRYFEGSAAAGPGAGFLRGVGPGRLDADRPRRRRRTIHPHDQPARSQYRISPLRHDGRISFAERRRFVGHVQYWAVRRDSSSSIHWMRGPCTPSRWDCGAARTAARRGTCCFHHLPILPAVETPSDHADARILTKAGRYPHVAALAIDPADSKSLYAAVSEGNAMTLSISADGGKSWKKSADLPSGVLRLYIDPASPRARPDDHRGDGKVPDGSLGRRMEGAPGAGAVHRYFRGDTRRPPDTCGSTVCRATACTSPMMVAATWRSSEIQPGAKPRLSAIATSAQHTEVAYASLQQSGWPAFRRRQDHRCRLHWTMVWKETSAEPAANVHDGWITSDSAQAGEAHR